MSFGIQLTQSTLLWKVLPLLHPESPQILDNYQNHVPILIEMYSPAFLSFSFNLGHYQGYACVFKIYYC